MHHSHKTLAGLLALALVACGHLPAPRRPPPPSACQQGFESTASAEELFFEAVRLHSAGLMDEPRWERLLDNLAWVDEHYGRDEDHPAQLRQVLLTALRLNRDALRQAGYSEVVEAEQSRDYARSLHRTGVKAAQEHAEGVLLISGMLGFPSSRGEAVLMVALPVGGHVVVKLGRVALQRAAFLLRRLHSADDVVDQARKLGFTPVYAASEAELRAAAGDTAVEVARHPGAHVGAGDGTRPGLHNPWNAEPRKDNCSACVAAVMKNSIEGTFRFSASDMERIFRYAGRERNFSVEQSLQYIENTTGLRANRTPIALLSANPPVGHYAIFTRQIKGYYSHVVYGRVTPTGRIIVFDPQSMEQMTFPELLKREGPARPYLLEAP